MDALAGFSSPTREWFAGAFAAPTQVQERTWPVVRGGGNVLAIAPTGSGKTLAAFLWAIDRCLVPREEPGVRVLYVSPLKALAVDVERNLRAPLVGIAAQCRAQGLPDPGISVGVRTGDTPSAERSAMLRRPPDVLITTPESLFLLLTSRAREGLAGVETVIVDEVHALAGTKRGAHLAVSLARLDRLAGRSIPRIGLSATVSPVGEVARFLGGDQPVEVIGSDEAKQWDVSIQVPVPDLADLPARAAEQGTVSDSVWPHVEARIVDLVEAHRSTIVFTNSRRLAERLTARLNEIHAERAGEAPGRAGAPAPPAQVMAQSPVMQGAPLVLARAHHGSVSREQRALIEDDLKSGRLRAVVATSSLELGIDMGLVDLVIQVEAPPSVSSGLQRVGRAGHQVGAISQGVVIPKFRGDLLASAVVVERMRTGQLETLRVPANPLDVAAQQIVACVAMDDWQVPDLLALLRTTASFQTLTPAVLEAVVDMLSGRYPSDAFAELRPRLVWDRLSDTLHARPGAQRLAVTSGGTIPDRGLFAVHLAGGGRVGELDEEMVYESRVGDVVALGASSWQVVEITHDRVNVVPAPGAPGRVPFWRGDALGRPAELGRAIGAFTAELAARGRDAGMAWLAERGLDQWAAENLLDYLAEQSASGAGLPSDRTLVVERTRDELGDWRLVVLSPYGARLHAPWALLARERLTARFGVDVSVQHGDDGLVARLPDLPDDDWLADATACLFPAPEDVEAAVTRLIGGSALFASRFRECASRALLLPRPAPGRRSPLWLQRQRSAQLLTVAAEHPTFPIVLEAVRECLQDVYDLPALVELMEQVATRRVRVLQASPSAPSPFTRSLLFGYIAEFLYEGDLPLAERRAAALTLDPVLLGELLGQADLRDLLDPAAIQEVQDRLQHLTDDRQARGVEDAADLLRVLGPLSGAGARARGVRPEWLDELVGSRRAFRTRIAGDEMTAAVEDAGRLRDGLGAPLPPGLPEAHVAPVADPIGDLVARYARTHGPFTAKELAGSLGLPVSALLPALGTPRGPATLVEGQFRSDAGGRQWCHPDTLRMIKRRSLGLLRQQLEPVAAEALAAFLPQWHGIGRRTDRLRGAGGVLAALTSMAGVPLPVSALETSILPARMPDYRRELLDELTSTGEVAWVGCGSLPGGDAWVALAPAEQAFLLPRDEHPPESGLPAQLLGLLSQGGGWFLADLVARLSGPGLGGPGPDEVAEALQTLLWGGWVSNDTLEPLRATRDRARMGTRSARPGQRLGRTPRGRYADLARARSPGAPGAHGGTPFMHGTAAQHMPGRWFVLNRPALAPEPLAVATAEAHLERLGLVTRGGVLAAGTEGGFAAAYRTLAAMEERGIVQRVHAVEGLGAAQFALPGVVDQLREVSRALEDGKGEVVVLAAADPANAWGAALEWPTVRDATAEGDASSRHRPSRAAGAHVVLVGGAPVLFVERGGHSLLWFDAGSDDEAAKQRLAQAAAGLQAAVHAGRVGPLAVTRINGLSALDTAEVVRRTTDALKVAGFSPTPKGVRAAG